VKPFPWQQEQWERFRSLLAQNRLPHALLLCGPEGIGLGEFATAVSRLLLCGQPPEQAPCGECRSCAQFDAGTHQDFLHVGIEEDKKEIAVGSVREMIDFMHLTTQYGRYKIAVIDPADALNRSSANTLLKTLEEPPANSLLILCSHRPDLLAVTIRSRCRRFEFPRAVPGQAVGWIAERLPDGTPELAGRLLAAAGNAPLLALALAESDGLARQQAVLADLRQVRRGSDPVSVAKRWNEYGAGRALGWVQAFLAELALHSLDHAAVRNSTVTNEHFQELTNELDLIGLISGYERAARGYQALQGSFNPNPLILLEEFLVDWQGLGSGRGGRQR
jgi:DNA polymerase-3 subunit delta'